MSGRVATEARSAATGNAGLHNVKSVEKAFAVLEAISEAGRSLGLGELAVATGLDKSAVQRFTRTLRELGYVDQDPVTRRYGLSLRVLDLSFSYLSSNELVARAAPSLVNLRATTNERIDMSLLDGDSLIYVLRMQSKQEPVRAALVGRRVPVYCTAGGRAVLSRLPEAEARRLVEAADRRAVTPRTLTDPDAIMERVASAREEGYAMQSDEWRLGELVVAAAILDEAGRPVGAVHLVGSTADWDGDTFARRMGPLVAVAAQDASG